jgi:C4-dicarboxylate transporter, DctM subunit
VLFLVDGTDSFGTVSDIGWNLANNFVLTAVPLFIFMGQIILSSGLSSKFFASFDKLLSGIPGGLLHSAILASGVFSAVSGSSTATAAAIGSVAVPEMLSRGYDRKMVLGNLAAGGTLGILIPPSIVMIVYAALEQQSVPALFAAGIVPGLLMMLLFVIYTGTRVGMQPHLAPQRTTTLPMDERIKALGGMLPLVLLIAVVLGTIYGGLATPTEAASLGCVGALALSAMSGGLSFTNFGDALRKAVSLNAMVMAIMLGAQISSFALVQSGVSTELTNWVVSLNLAPLALFVVLVILYLMLGCIIDGMSMMLLTLPLVYPIVLAVGFNSIWFGIILVVLIEFGMITPPVGLNLFVLQGISRGSLGEVVRGALPYCGLMILLLISLYIFPQIALWLPDRLAR